MSRTRPAFLIIAAALQLEPPAAGPPVIGVIAVPRLLNVYAPTSGEPLVPRGVRIALRAKPAADSPVVASVTTPDDLVTVEYGYEAIGAIVHGRDGTWSLVRTAGGVSGWMAASDAGEFISLQALLDRTSVAYLTDGWDGVLVGSAGGRNRVEIQEDSARRFVGYIEPDVPDVDVVLKPGEDSEKRRESFRESLGSTSIGSRPGPNGTRVLSLEPGIVVPLFEKPTAATVAAHVQTNRVYNMLQTTHQSPPQVLVFDAQPGWYQVARENFGQWRTAPRVWLQATPLWRYHPVNEPREMKALAERAWGAESRDVRVLDFRNVDGRLWVEIELVAESECETLDPPEILARGWLPAHSSTGTLNIWYHPRGC